MVDIRVMRMAVPQWCVRVAVNVWFRAVPAVIVRMPMVFVMTVTV